MRKELLSTRYCKVTTISGKTQEMLMTDFLEETHVEYITLRNALKRGTLPKMLIAKGINQVEFDGMVGVFYVETLYK